MNHLIRTFCLLLAVASLASIMMHGPVDARDQAEHMVDEIAQLHGIDVTGHAHPDCDDTVEPDDQPASGHHHHHGGGEHSVALSDKAGLMPALTSPHANLGWPQGRAPDDLSLPGPDQPPKRTQTLV